jgi:hypothetical protein
MGQTAMEVDEILNQLEVFSTPFPSAAAESAVERREEIAPRLVRILEDTVQNAALRARQDPAYMAHLYAMFLLAQFRDRRAYAPLIALAWLPDGLPELLLGDAQCEYLPQALASVWDGDLDPLKALIEDEAVDEYSRMAGLGAIVTLVTVGKLARETAIAYFAELFDGRLRGSGGVWGDLVSSACDLHPGDLYPRIVRAFEQDLVDEMMVTMEDVREARRLSPDEALAKIRQDPHNNLITDTAGDMQSWACFREPYNEPDDDPDEDWDESAPDWIEFVSDWDWQPIRRTQPKIGRNQPCPCGSRKKFKKCCGG